MVFGVRCSRHWSLSPASTCSTGIQKAPKLFLTSWILPLECKELPNTTKNSFSRHTDPTTPLEQEEAARQQSRAHKNSNTTTDSKLASSSYCQNSSQARAGRNLPAPAGLHLPPRTRRFKKPPLEFNPNKFLAGSSTAGRDAAQGRSESQELLLVKSFSLWVRRDNKGANHRSSFAILSRTRPVHPALLVKGLKSRGRPRSRRGKICQWCI